MKKKRSRITRVLSVVAVAIAVAGLGVGIWLLVIVLRGVPVAAAFTRVGGTTNMQTAVDASRFWLTRPQHVVETPANAPRQVMLGAAHCAMVNDAPLLFTSTHRKREQLVRATTQSWWGKTAKRHITTILGQKQIENCLDKNEERYNPVKVTGLSVLQVPGQQRQLRGLQLKLPAQRTLAPFVVFAAPIAPGQEPDVAVGLAVAEHLAKADGEQVSLVVIQRYLEADPKLEEMLRTQPALVTGGIVLGQIPTVPADTQALLRQVLTTADRQSLANQIQATLGSAGPLIAALLALVALGAAAALAAPVIIAVGTGTIRELLIRPQTRPVITPDPPPKTTLLDRVRRLWRSMMPGPWNTPAESTPKGREWLHALTDEELKQEVTISLRSGWTVTGTFPQQNDYKARNMTVWRIDVAKLGQDGAQLEKARYVLVPVVDIELIRVNDPD